jgi:hypothetical protein
MLRASSYEGKHAKMAVKRKMSLSNMVCIPVLLRKGPHPRNWLLPEDLHLIRICLYFWMTALKCWNLVQPNILTLNGLGEIHSEYLVPFSCPSYYASLHATYVSHWSRRGSPLSPSSWGAIWGRTSSGCGSGEVLPGRACRRAPPANTLPANNRFTTASANYSVQEVHTHVQGSLSFS